MGSDSGLLSLRIGPGLSKSCLMQASANAERAGWSKKLCAARALEAGMGLLLLCFCLNMRPSYAPTNPVSFLLCRSVLRHFVFLQVLALHDRRRAAPHGADGASRHPLGARRFAPSSGRTALRAAFGGGRRFAPHSVTAGTSHCLQGLEFTQ